MSILKIINFKKYGKLLGAYSLGIFLNQSINLILIPIFWKELTPADFGIIAITQIVALFLQPIYLFGASETIQRFYYRWTDEERPHFISWFFWFVLCFTLLLTIILDLLGSYFAKFIIVNVPFSPLLRLSLWSTFFANFINFPIAISRIQQKIGTYNILVNGSFFTQIGIVYYLVKIEHLGAYGYVSGFFLANAIWFFPILIMILKESIFFPSRKFFKIPLNYAAPISFAGIIEGFTIVLDRYFLDKYLPLATIGFYNLARQFGSLINILNTVTKLIFVPYIYKINALKNNAAFILGHFGLIYGVIMTIPVLAVCTMAREVVHILDPRGVYLVISEYIPYFAISFYFVSLAIVKGRGMDLAGVTKWSFSIPLCGSLVSLLIYLTTLPESGVKGILWGFIAGNFTRSFINIMLAVYYFPRKLHLEKLVLAWLVSALFYFILRSLEIPNDYVSIITKLGLLLLLTVIHIKLVLFKNLMDIFYNKVGT